MHCTKLVTPIDSLIQVPDTIGIMLWPRIATSRSLSSNAPGPGPHGVCAGRNSKPMSYGNLVAVPNVGINH